MVATTRVLRSRTKSHYLFLLLKIRREIFLNINSDKINSLVAAFATKCFNKHLSAEYEEELYKHRENFEDSFRLTSEEQESQKHLARFQGKLGEAYFDCRCFGVRSFQCILMEK